MKILSLGTITVLLILIIMLKVQTVELTSKLNLVTNQRDALEYKFKLCKQLLK